MNHNAALAVGRIPSGVSVLTACFEKRSTGMLASWVQQASFEPLMISVCVKCGRWIQDLIDGSGMFVVNILEQDPKHTFKHFAAGFPPEADAFEGLDVDRSGFGVELRTAAARLRCRVVAKIAAGDHDLYLADVLDGGVLPGDVRPHVHIRKTGSSY